MARSDAKEGDRQCSASLRLIFLWRPDRLLSVADKVPPYRTIGTSQDARLGPWQLSPICLTSRDMRVIDMVQEPEPPETRKPAARPCFLACNLTD